VLWVAAGWCTTSPTSTVVGGAQHLVKVTEFSFWKLIWCRMCSLRNWLRENEIRKCLRGA